MPICYVVMPYGGDDPALHAKFEAIYENIIRDAAKSAGFKEEEIIREDHGGDAGAITRNIVNHIKNADIVIADLTGGNPNVHYELGISHVFHKSSTVLICEKRSPRAFDVQHLQIIEYSTAIEEFSSSKEKITEAIRKRLEGRTPSDSPVHEAMPGLPKHLTDWLNAEDDEQKNRIARLEQENERLKTQLERAGIKTGDFQKKRLNPQELLRSGMEALAYSGSSAVERVKSLVEKGEYEGLFEYLIKVTEHGRLTNRDASSILETCEKTDNLVVVECVTQIVAYLFPMDIDFQTKLAKVYTKLPGRREEAVEILNSALGLQKDENGEYTDVDITKLTYNNLGRLFDTYLSFELYDELIRVGRFLLSHGGTTQKNLIQCNIFAALTRAYRFDEAESMLPEVEAGGDSLNQYQIARFYDLRGDMVNAYRYYERAFIGDVRDKDYPRLLAVHILNEKLLRTEDGIEAVPPKKAQLAAAALLFYNVEIARGRRNSGAIQNVLTILGREYNGLTQYVAPVLAYARGERDALPYDEVDTSALQYCLGQAES